MIGTTLVSSGYKTKTQGRRILFLTTVRFTEHAGGVVYSKSLCDAFSAKGTVTLTTLSEHQRSSSRVFRWINAAIRSLFTLTPPNVLFHSSNLTASTIDIINQDWDVIVIDHLESAYALPVSKSAVIYVSHNRESGLVSQKIPAAPSWLQRLFAIWVDHYEQKIVRSVDAVISISSAEARWYRKFNQFVIVLHPAFNSLVPPLSPAVNNRLRIGFIGSSKWKPNRDAMDLLLSNILPLSKRQLELVIAGSGWNTSALESKVRRHIEDGQFIIKNLGYVEDIRDFWMHVDVFIAPITKGAGVNVKVCEALSNARPVIALPHATRGIEGVDQKLIINASDPDEFARCIDSFNANETTGVPPIEFSQPYMEKKISNLLDELFVKASK